MLLADDDHLLLSQLMRELEAFDAIDVVGPVRSLAQGLKAADQRIDVAVTEVRLDGILAYPLIDALVARGIPVILMTAFRREELRGGYRSLPMLHKPMKVAAIAGYVRSTVGGVHTPPLMFDSRNTPDR